MPVAREQIAVLIPCYNEEASIAKVVGDFRAVLPGAIIYVFDNNSVDRTVAAARDAGAVVRHERNQGKGNVVRRMFADIDADIYVLVDGDATYEAAAAPRMIDLLRTESLDMVTGLRRTGAKAAYRPGHAFGNRMFSFLVSKLFGHSAGDMLSGYRVFSRRFVRSFPALSRGFEIETELTIHAMELRLPVAEVETVYGARGEGSSSKLSTIRDGIRILMTIVTLLKEERPLPFFCLTGLAIATLAVALSMPLLITYLETGLVPRLPTAILVTGMIVVAVLCVFSGLILDSVARGRRELKRLSYLAYPAAGRAGDESP